MYLLLLTSYVRNDKASTLTLLTELLLALLWTLIRARKQNIIVDLVISASLMILIFENIFLKKWLVEYMIIIPWLNMI